MNEKDFLDWVNRAIGYQAHVFIDKKPWAQPQKAANPFATPTMASDQWYPVKVVVGIDTMFGFQKMTEQTTYELAYKDIVKNYPNIGGM